MKELNPTQIPPLPFFALVVVIDSKIFWTKQRKIWETEIKKRQNEMIIFFPVSDNLQLVSLKTLVNSL